MTQGGNHQENDLYEILRYSLPLLPTSSPSSYPYTPRAQSESPSSSLQIDSNFIRSILEKKINSLQSLLVDVLNSIQQTKSLEALLLSYLDAHIIKVENHLLQIDFWQNHSIHPDVMTLRAQMQQQLFQLEQEKVRTQVQVNNQLMQLSKEARATSKELNELQIHQETFK